MAELWEPLENKFINGTKNSKKRMNTVCADTGDKIDFRKAETGIGALNTYYKPFRTSFQNKYALWFSTNGTYNAATQTTERLKAELSGVKAKRWSVKVENEYIDDPDKYKAIFPNGRAPFQEGSYESRLTALQALSNALTGIDALRDTKTEVDTFLAQFQAARTLQQGKESMVDELSRQVEVERVSVGVALYYVLGGLMQIYSATPDAIAAFFDLETLRRTGAEEDEPEGGLVLTLAPGQTLEAGITFTADTVLLVINHGEVPLSVFTGGDTPVPPASPFVLQPGEEVEKPVTELGDPANRYLYIQNNNPDLAGSIEIIDVTPVEG
jgi:hypothetical protein